MDKKKNKITCYSGGAEGADSYFEYFSLLHQLAVVPFSYKTKFHNSEHKRELTEDEYHEGVAMVVKVNEVLKRSHIQKYYRLLARNWFQIKYVKQVFAIGEFVRSSHRPIEIKGGTAWAVEMAKIQMLPIYFYEQKEMQWFEYDYKKFQFVLCKDKVKITENAFAGIGTRKINIFGIGAIEQLFKNSFEE
ncbi:hypothetical protein AB4865_11530 [Capnocytophaga sp. ARDL2]|uniref:hypothetical protein n=1 Tax=Capnocytophaga sp. ARDL2 TaxID=3238809 RepID=UPI003557240E